MQNIITPDYTWEDGYYSSTGRINTNNCIPKYSPEYIRVRTDIEYILKVQQEESNNLFAICEYDENLNFVLRQYGYAHIKTLKFTNPYIRVSFNTFGHGKIKLIPIIEEDEIIVNSEVN